MSDLVVTVRASSWGGLFDCAYKWEAEHLLGMYRPSGLRATLGTAVHAGAAAFDQSRMDGNPMTVNDAAEVTMDALHNPDGEVDYTQDRSFQMRDAERVALTLHTRYCTEISPHYTFKAIEMRLDPVAIDCGNGVTINLTGTMDRARVATIGTVPIPGSEWELVEPGGVIIPDLKTGTRLIENGQVVLKGKSAQLGAYELMYQQTSGEPTVGGQIIALPTSGEPRPRVSRIIDAKAKMIGTAEAPGFIELAATMFKQGFFPPNPQSPLCSPKYCGRWDKCQYHD